jgi:hypothetical protein
MDFFASASGIRVSVVECGGKWNATPLSARHGRRTKGSGYFVLLACCKSGVTATAVQDASGFGSRPLKQKAPSGFAGRGMKFYLT